MSRSSKPHLSYLLALATAACPAVVQAEPSAKFDAAKNTLNVYIPADEATMVVDALLNRFAAKTVRDTATEVIKISNFRTSLGTDRVAGGKFTVRFDYSAKRRGYTNNPAYPFGPKRIYSPWVSDSGTIEVPVFLKIVDWELRASTNYRDIKLASNHTISNWILEGLGFEFEAKGAVYDSLRQALRDLLGGKTLRDLLVEKGAPKIAPSLGVNSKAAEKMLQSGMDNVQADAFIKTDGLYVAFKLEHALFKGLAVVDPTSPGKGLVKKPTGTLSADDFKIIKKPESKPNTLDPKPPTPPKPNTPTAPKPSTPKTIQCELANSTPDTVYFRLNGGAGLATSLAPGKSTRFNVVVDPGVVPAVYIKQKNGAELNFSLKDGDRYAFLVQNGQIVNSYR